MEGYLKKPGAGEIIFGEKHGIWEIKQRMMNLKRTVFSGPGKKKCAILKKAEAEFDEEQRCKEGQKIL